MPEPHHGVIEELIAALQSVRRSGTTRCVVLSGAGGAEEVESLGAQVALLMRQRGLQLTAIRVCEAGDSKQRLAAHPSLFELRLALHGSDWRSTLDEWRNTLDPGSVALLIARNLPSAEAALVAGACDGLVIVVELNRTSRRALQQAVRRAETDPCRLLGLIVIGNDGLPSWARRWLGSESFE